MPLHAGVSQNWGVPYCGVPKIRIIIYCGLYWGPSSLGREAAVRRLHSSSVVADDKVDYRGNIGVM